MVADVRFDQFYRYEALTQLLKRYAADEGHVRRANCIGVGRDEEAGFRRIHLA